MTRPPKLLVTDFDGTLTRRDFFWLAVEAFPPARLDEYWSDYRAGRLSHFEALARIFAGLRATEAQMEELIRRAEPDPELAAHVGRLHRAGWEVVVASAGCAWYIERVLARTGVSLPVHANPGTFVPGEGLFMRPPLGSPFYSPTLGVDKAAVVRAGLGEGRVVAFAGDGVPDLEAARLPPPPLRFARADLAAALDAEGLTYRPFARWADVARALCAACA